MTFPRTAAILTLLILALPAWSGASEIHDAISACDLAKVQAILKNNPELLNVRDKDGLTPLALAARIGEAKIAKSLLKSGADYRIGDGENTLPIHFAAASGIEEAVDALLEAGAGIDERDDNGTTPLIFAASRKKYGSIEHLIDKGADINARSSKGFSALLYGIVFNSKYLVGLLIEKGADLDVRTAEGATPLHSAASYGRTNLLKMLVENGADVHAEDDLGDTPLCWALNQNSYQGAVTLIENGADVNHRNHRGGTPLLGAAQRGNLNIVKLFIENGADVNAMEQGGWTPLTGAAFSSLEVVKYLISMGAEVNPQKSKQAKAAGLAGSMITPLHAAVRHGQEEIAAFLIETGADVLASNTEGFTAVHMAVNEGRPGLVKKLLEHGAAIGSMDNRFGRAELHTAACKGYTDVVEVLLDAGADPGLKDKAGKTSLDYALNHGFKQTAHRLAGGDLDKGKSKDAGSAGVLAKKLSDREAFIWHLGHSGWAVKTRNHFLLFDYNENPRRVMPPEVSLASGYIIPADLADQNVCVFSSHAHGDHYNEKIFEWKESLPKVKYVMGFEPERIPAETYIHMPPRKEKAVDGMKIYTIQSTDEGVAFLVEVDGLTIFHAGDHANGHNESSKLYKEEIDRLAKRGLHLDISFFPITGCGLGDPDSVREGVVYAMKKLVPKVLFPMHGGDTTYRYLDFAEAVSQDKGAVEIISAINMGDRFHYRNERDLTRR